MTLDDLLTPLTIDEAKASVYSILVQLGVPTTGWAVGSVVRCIVALVAIVCVAISRIIVEVAKGGLRDTSTGDWQTLHAQDTYGVTRIAATFGTGTATLSNTGGGVYNPAAGDVVLLDPATNKTFRNVALFSLGAGSPGSPTTATIDVVAVEAGSASNALPNAGLQLVTTMSGVTVTANTAIIGTDRETDDQLRIREDESLDALSVSGPAGAYLAVAKKALRADGTNIGVTRCLVSPPSSVGIVTVTVATAAGEVSDTGTPSDLDYVNDYIQGVIPPGCVPAGPTVTVVSAIAQAIDMTATLYVYTTDGRTKTELEAAAESLVTAWLAAKPISGDTGGKIYQAAIKAKAMSVSQHCYNASISLPAGDVTITSGYVPVAGTLAITVVPVTP